jgi:hypothetical protein
MEYSKCAISCYCYCHPVMGQDTEPGPLHLPTPLPGPSLGFGRLISLAGLDACLQCDYGIKCCDCHKLPSLGYK